MSNKPFSRIASSVSLYPLILGIAVGMVFCSIAGRFAGKTGIDKNFLRIHTYLSADAFFYPTATQLIYQIKNFAPKDKQLILIGGNSTFQGYGQDSDELWSTKLQEKLGPKYNVVNFAAHGSTSGEIGNAVFLSIANEYPDSLFVFNSFHSSEAPIDGGRGPYQSFFWDAYYKGYFSHIDQEFLDHVRSTRTAQLKDDNLLEQHILSAIDAITYSKDLWTYFAYHHFFTVWNDLTNGRTFSPRNIFADPPFNLPPFEARLKRWKSDLSYLLGQFKPSLVAELNAPNSKISNGELNKSALETSFRTFQPMDLHQRTLVAIIYENSFLLDNLSKELLEIHQTRMNATQSAVLAQNYHSIYLGKIWPLEDYESFQHFTPSGGDKAASSVAEAILKMPRK
jgi:hypothetical protein